MYAVSYTHLDVYKRQPYFHPHRVNSLLRDLEKLSQFCICLVFFTVIVKAPTLSKLLTLGRQNTCRLFSSDNSNTKFLYKQLLKQTLNFLLKKTFTLILFQYVNINKINIVLFLETNILSLVWSL